MLCVGRESAAVSRAAHIWQVRELRRKSDRWAVGACRDVHSFFHGLAPRGEGLRFCRVRADNPWRMAFLHRRCMAVVLVTGRPIWYVVSQRSDVQRRDGFLGRIRYAGDIVYPAFTCVLYENGSIRDCEINRVAGASTS